MEGKMIRYSEWTVSEPGSHQVPTLSFGGPTEQMFGKEKMLVFVRKVSDPRGRVSSMTLSRDMYDLYQKVR